MYGWDISEIAIITGGTDHKSRNTVVGRRDGLPTGRIQVLYASSLSGARRWGTVYIGATSCTVKRATRADLRLTPLSLRSSFPLSFTRTPCLASLSLFLSRYAPHPLFHPHYRSSSLCRSLLRLSILLSPLPLAAVPALSLVSLAVRALMLHNSRSANPT